MKCRADLRVCLNCQSYDPRVAQQCRERRAEPEIIREALPRLLGIEDLDYQLRRRAPGKPLPFPPR